MNNQIKKLRFITLIVLSSTLLVSCLVFPVSAGIKPAILQQHDYSNDGSVCAKCGKTFTGSVGEQSQVAKALGLTFCIDCWLDSFYGSDRSDPLPKVALLGEDGKVLASQLPAGQGGITGEGLDAVFASNGLLKRTGTATYTIDDATYVTGTPWTGMGYLTANQNVSLSGDLSGNGTTSISGTVTGIKGAVLPTLSTGYLYYNGSSFAFQTPEGGSTPDPVSNINLVDEFMGGSLEAGEIGNLGWSYTTTAPTITASVVNHPGIRRITTSTTSGAVNAFWTGAAATNDLIQYSEQWDFTYIVSIPTITTVSVFCGALDAMVTAVGNQDRYGFEFNPATSAYWRMVTGNGSTSTSTNTNVAVVAGTWYALRIVRTSSGVDYYIDEVSKGSISTTLPDTTLSFGPQVQTLTTAARSLDVDFFRMTLTLARVGTK